MESFAYKVKEEIINNKWTNEEKRLLIATSLFFAKKDKDFYFIKSKIPNFTKLIIEHIKSHKKINISTKIIGKHEVLFFPLTLGDEYLQKFKIKKNDLFSILLAGLFLSKGSVNSPNTKFYHYEIKTKTKEVANDLIRVLECYDIEAKTINTKLGQIIYIKKASMISDILKLMKAPNAVIYFEDIRINRDFSTSLKRLATIDVYNTQKAMLASKRQITTINKVFKKNLLKHLHPKYTNIANLRLKNPDLNLVLLAKEYNKKYGTNHTKSAIFHWLRFIEKIEEKYINA